MRSSEDLAAAGDLLRRVATGSSAAVDALAGWCSEDASGDPDLEAAWHELSHFVADADIRGRDERYDQHMRSRLLDLAGSLLQRAKRA